MQNIPIKTELGRELRKGFNKPPIQGGAFDVGAVCSRPFSHFAEQEARAYELVRGGRLMKDLMARLPPGVRVISQVHDEITLDMGRPPTAGKLKELTEILLGAVPGEYADLKVEPDLNGDVWPPMSEEDKEAMMAGMYGCGGPPQHHHITTECSGACQKCGEQIHDSHETRIKKLERRVSDMENNLRELAGVEKG